MFRWEHRMVRTGDGDKTIYLVEVSFNKDGKPYGYNEPFMCSESKAGLRGLLALLADALKKPVLDYDKDFVKEEALNG